MQADNINIILNTSYYFQQYMHTFGLRFLTSVSKLYGFYAFSP